MSRKLESLVAKTDIRGEERRGGKDVRGSLI
jgi:hypothetical protein